MSTSTHQPPSLANRSTALAKPSNLGAGDFKIPLLLFLFSVAYLAMFVRYSALEPDEGIVLQGAQRILDGQVPYRDFFTFYTPGSFYLVAGLFKIFGDSFAVARLSILITGSLFPVITYLLARRACSRLAAVYTALLATFAAVGYRFLVLHNWYSTLLACLALYAAVRMIETRERGWAFGAGSLCSLTVLFEQSKGAGICFGLVLGFLTQRLLQRRRLFSRSTLVSLGTGFLWPMVLVFAYFDIQHSMSMMLQAWFWPLRHYGLANHVPYGYQNWSDDSRNVIFHTGPTWAIAVKVLAVSPVLIIPGLATLALAGYVYWSARAFRRNTNPDKCTYYIVVSGALIGVLSSVIFSRADVIHFMYLSPLWLILLSWVLEVRIRSQFLAKCRAVLAVLLAVSFGLMGLALLSTATGAQNKIVTRKGVIKTNKPDSVIPFVAGHDLPGESVLVYPYLPLYYYLTGTRSIAQLDYFQPGMNTSEQAGEIIASLQLHPASAVLFEPGFFQKIGTSWPDTPINVVARDSIVDYIAHNYRVCQLLYSGSATMVQYMVRRERQCP